MQTNNEFKKSIETTLEKMHQDSGFESVKNDLVEMYESTFHNENAMMHEPCVINRWHSFKKLYNLLLQLQAKKGKLTIDNVML